MDTMHCQKIKMSRQHSYQVFIDITLRYKFYIIFDRTCVPELVQCIQTICNYCIKSTVMENTFRVF